MPNLPFQIITLTADFLIFIFFGYYFLKLRKKEKEVEQKEGKIDTDYHHVVDEALSKERKILEDATTQADQIILSAQSISSSSKDSVNQALQKMIADIQQSANLATQEFANTSKISKETIDQALAKMLSDTQKESIEASQGVMQSYSSSLKQLSATSLTNFQTITKELETDLQQQIKQFHETLLPSLEKEVEEYKKARFKQAEQTISHVVQKVSREVLHSAISLNDHQNLIAESLEKAKKEGIFE